MLPARMSRGVDLDQGAGAQAVPGSRARWLCNRLFARSAFAMPARNGVAPGSLATGDLFAHPEVVILAAS
jgi:hypothetical protein